jgi:ACT domain-containing protein
VEHLEIQTQVPKQQICEFLGLRQDSLKFDLTLALADRPGQLLKALEPIAKNGGNIISIIHERKKSAEGYVPVSLVVDFPLKQNLIRTISDLKKLGATMIKSEEIVDATRLTLILIGRMNLKRLIETKIENVRIISFEVSAPSSREACIKLDLEVPTSSVGKVLDELRSVSNKENAILITPV